ncbi:MAG: hypothetical protein HYS12_09385 [Planctomycetes bacterium]|nr:hypothetical protein [Planctomycetota bacterium]
MADYFLLLDAALFEGRMRPALAESWRRRSFEPCRDFCVSLLPRVEDFTRRYHVGEGEPLAAQVARGLVFHRDFWRALAGELLFHAADEVPEFQTCPDTLCCLLAPEHPRERAGPRERFAPIQQAHFGTRDLTFGGIAYRPDHCGLNDLDDVRRLAGYLASVDPVCWHADDLAPLPDLAEEDRAEELEIARDWFAPLRAMYERAAAKSQVVVHEFL